MSVHYCLLGQTDPLPDLAVSGMHQRTVASYEHGKQGRKTTRSQEAEKEETNSSRKPDGGRFYKEDLPQNIAVGRSEHLPAFL